MGGLFSRPLCHNDGSAHRAGPWDLELWLEDRKTWPLHSDYVFCSVDGTRLSTAAVQGIVREANKRAGFRKQVWPHVFRHTRITELLNNGMSLQDTAVMAGHTDVRTTMRYYHQEPSRLKEEYDKATSDSFTDQGGVW